jgi:hypothetical protein
MVNCFDLAVICLVLALAWKLGKSFFADVFKRALERITASIQP